MAKAESLNFPEIPFSSDRHHNGTMRCSSAGLTLFFFLGLPASTWKAHINMCQFLHQISNESWIINLPHNIGVPWGYTREQAMLRNLRSWINVLYLMLRFLDAANNWISNVSLAFFDSDVEPLYYPWLTHGYSKTWLSHWSRDSEIVLAWIAWRMSSVSSRRCPEIVWRTTMAGRNCTLGLCGPGKKTLTSPLQMSVGKWWFVYSGRCISWNDELLLLNGYTKWRHHSQKARKLPVLKIHRPETVWRILFMLEASCFQLFVIPCSILASYRHQSPKFGYSAQECHPYAVSAITATHHQEQAKFEPFSAALRNR